MWDKNVANLIFAKKYFGVWLIAGMCVLGPKNAAALTADDVLNKMSSKEQYSYLAGLVGGFAHSRYLKERPSTTGMNCIYDWYHTDIKKSWSRIDTWFSRHLEKPVEPLVYVLIKKECGE